MRFWKVIKGVVEYLGLFKFNTIALFVGAFLIPFSVYYLGKLVVLIAGGTSSHSSLLSFGQFVEKTGEVLANFIYGNSKIYSGDFAKTLNPVSIILSFVKSWFVGILFLFTIIFVLDSFFPRMFDEFLIRFKYIEYMKAKIMGNIEKMKKIGREIAELELRYNHKT